MYITFNILLLYQHHRFIVKRLHITQYFLFDLYQYVTYIHVILQ